MLCLMAIRGDICKCYPVPDAIPIHAAWDMGNKKGHDC